MLFIALIAPTSVPGLIVYGELKTNRACRPLSSSARRPSSRSSHKPRQWIQPLQKQGSQDFLRAHALTKANS
jgi:hypothetical protein